MSDHLSKSKDEIIKELNAAKRQILELKVVEKERKLADKLLLRQIKTNEGVYEIFRTALHCETEQDLSKKFLSIVQHIMESEIALIGFLDSDEVEPFIGLQSPTDFRIQELLELNISFFRSQKTRYSNNTKQDPSWKNLSGVPINQVLTSPLVHKNKMIGFMVLLNKKAGYDSVDRKSVESLSTAYIETLKRKQKDEEIKNKNLIIQKQSQEILQLSTPVLEVANGVILAPIIGTLDSERARQVTDRLLNKLVESKSEVAIIDITGVPTIDTQTAQYFIEAIQAVRLIGGNVILTGISPSIAQTIVELGIDISKIYSMSSLSSGFEEALNILKKEVTQINIL